MSKRPKILEAQHEYDTNFDRALGQYTGEGEQQVPHRNFFETVNPDALLDGPQRQIIKDILAVKEVEHLEGYGFACTRAFVSTAIGDLEIISEIAGMGGGGAITVKPAEPDSSARQNVTARILGLFDPKTVKRSFAWNFENDDDPHTLGSEEAVVLTQQLLDRENVQDIRDTTVMESGRTVAKTRMVSVAQGTLCGVPVKVTRIGAGMFNQVVSVVIDPIDPRDQ